MIIRMEKIGKRFSDEFQIKDFDLIVEDGNFTTLLGPSGCGKTTVLRMIAGLENPDEGEIFFDDTCVFSDKKKINIPPEKRNLGFVFQDFALWPHMTVFDNVAFPLRAKRQKTNISEQVKKALNMVRLDDYESRYPKQLSGGQQQRVAFARAIVGKPSCILFDEPLSALDAILRENMRVEMTRITKELGSSAVFVTHDQLEAMSMSDEIVVMNKGRIEQIGVPEQIYQQPGTRFVAKFIGKSNWIDDNSMVRPENISVFPKENHIEYKVKISSVQFLGNAYELRLDGNGFQWQILSMEKKKPDEQISIFVDRNSILRFS